MTSAHPDIPRWEPTDRQRAFLASSAYEALYGGAAGGGKTDALVIGALRFVDRRGYNAIIFRRTFPELEGQVIPKSREWYPICGGSYNSVQHCWTFPSGARVHFGHLQHEDDVYRYQGWEFQYVGFDELTSFTERQYTYLLSRARSASGIPVRIRSATNPGGEGHEWVMRRWGPWLDPQSKVQGEPGRALHYRNTDQGEQWTERGADTLSRVFVPAKVQDNPHLYNSDRAYVERLKGLDVVTREQLLHGNWLIKPAPGLLFRRAMFKMLDTAPMDVIGRVRFWDRAATEEDQGSDPDWTIGVRMSRPRSGGWCVEDVVRLRGSPKVVEETIRRTAESDGVKTEVHLSQDPGSAGKFEASYYVNALAGFVVRATPETGDKVSRAQPFSAQCEAGNVSMVRGPWNEPYWQILEAFPSKGVHDDDVDASSGAFAALTDGVAEYIAAMKAVGAGR